MPGRDLTRTNGHRLTLESLCAAANLHPDLVERLVAYGLLEPISRQESVLWFDVRAVRRLKKICRLRDDLGINLPGIAVVLDLLERIEVLQRQVTRLRRG